jgi:hypothetical protein
MNQSQENCLSDNHRLTCERWGGDYASRLYYRLIQIVFLLNELGIMDLSYNHLFTSKVIIREIHFLYKKFFMSRNCM